MTEFTNTFFEDMTMIASRIMILTALVGLASLAACAPAPDPIPTEDVAGIAAQVYAESEGGDIEAMDEMASLSLEYYGNSETSGTYSESIDGGFYTLDYLLNYTIDLAAGSAEWTGSITSTVTTDNLDGSVERDSEFTVTGLNDPATSPLVFNGTIDGDISGSLMVGNFSSTVEASWAQTWTNVEVDKDCTGICYPTGTVDLSGTIATTSTSNRGSSAGAWTGSVTATFDGTNTASFAIDGSTFSVNLTNGLVTEQQ